MRRGFTYYYGEWSHHDLHRSCHSAGGRFDGHHHSDRGGWRIDARVREL
ncbi:MAG TPA: hypothetical protein VNY09_04790 [Candidatus Sulfotelmatobacter sp.]|jgi:hypothetical protein|nr:hypothetical protein [Candidatus Sulfotelmatobacter sp.]